ncbi:MAG TPA: DMT family transporter [Candidatus Saccharimonadales bacterium]|jgi:drug/metabolite transporter (DMT)-like permease|nr:DMT family transporter [Candidatus Saccharimonadales bacterium]
MPHAAFLAALFGLLTAIGWGLSDFWSARATKALGPITTLFYVNLIGAAAYAIVYILFLHPHVAITQAGFIYTLLESLLVTVAAILFYKSLDAGPVSLVSPISGAYPLVSTLLAIIVFQAHVSLLQAAAICVVVLGVMAASGVFSIKNTGQRISRGPLLAVIAIFFYGSGFTCAAQAVNQLGWQLPILISWFASLPIMLIPFVRGKEHIFAGARRALSNRFLAGSALIGVTAYVTMNLGFSHDKAAGAITIAVSACYPALTMVLAIRHFKEKMTLVPLLGAIATIAGVVLLTLA